MPEKDRVGVQVEGAVATGSPRWFEWSDEQYAHVQKSARTVVPGMRASRRAMFYPRGSGGDTPPTLNAHVKMLLAVINDMGVRVAVCNFSGTPETQGDFVWFASRLSDDGALDTVLTAAVVGANGCIEAVGGDRLIPPLPPQGRGTVKK